MEIFIVVSSVFPCIPFLHWCRRDFLSLSLGLADLVVDLLQPQVCPSVMSKKKEKLVTTADLLGALEESERGQLCSDSYRRMAREGINMDLTVIMVHRTSLHRMLRALLLRECLGTGNSSET